MEQLVEDWVEDSLCADLYRKGEVTTKTWFPDPSDEEAVAYAKSICDMCPVAELCLQAALARREKWGIWGGWDENQRKVYLRDGVFNYA